MELGDDVGPANVEPTGSVQELIRVDDEGYEHDFPNNQPEPVVTTEPENNNQEPVNKEELEKELAAIEEEIQHLKDALVEKGKQLAEVKKKLGYTDMTTIAYDVKEGINKIGESEPVQKTQRAFAQARSKTIDAAEDVKEKVSTSIENIKNSETFKNISETVGSAIGAVKDAFVKSTYGTLPEEGD